MANRIIALIDMDCFYAQVEQKLNPEIQGKPCAVIQYKKWKGGSIIAVNYEARAKGVTRSMYGDDAKSICPDICLARVPESRGKADLTRYRDASKDVFAVLCEFSEFVERASIDEAYIDLTSEVQKKFKDLGVGEHVSAENLLSTHIVGSEKENQSGSQNDDYRNEGVNQWLQEIYDENMPNVLDQQLAIAAEIVEKIRAAVYKQTSFHCSAGIAHNKMLAKLACGINKPQKQTVVPQSSVPGLFAHLSLKKVRNLGGKLGDSLVDVLNCQTMGDLSKISLKELETHFGDKTGSWLFDLGRGIENEPVNPRQLAKSIGCSKNFSGKAALKKKDDVKYWVEQLAAEVVERLTIDIQVNKRMAKVLSISIRFGGNNESNNVTRSCPIHVYAAERIANDVMSVLSKLNDGSKGEWSPMIICLGISAGKFQDHIEGSMANIKSFFNKGKSNDENPGIKNNQNLNLVNEKEKSVCEKLNIKESKGNIKWFFNKEKSIEETLNQESNSTNQVRDNVESESNIKKSFTKEKSNDETVLQNVNSSDNSTDGSIETPVKGFFATKMEEFLRKSRDLKFRELKMEENDSDNYALPEVRELGKKSSKLASKKAGIMKFFDNKSDKKQECHNEEASCSYVDLDVDSPRLVPDDCFLCEDCEKMISVWNTVEHSDYHMAIKLQQEFNSEPRSQNSVRTTVSLSSVKPKNSKRKVRTQSSSKCKKSDSQPDQKIRKIETFFSKEK